MADPTTEFFAALARHGHEPLLADVTGTIRYDLVSDRGTDSWFVEIRRGDLRVLHEMREADCVVRTKRELFNRFVTGEASNYAAWLRNELRIEGEVQLSRYFQRLAPGPPGAHHPRTFARERRQRA
jgi:hypothetical protein